MKEEDFLKTNRETQSSISGMIEAIVAEDPVGRKIEFLRKEKILGDLEKGARSILEADRVYILTGFFIPAAGTIETDGISGACFIGRALHGLGKDVSVLNDPHNQKILKEGFLAIGFSPKNISPDFNTPPNTWIEYRNKSCIISIERPGMGIDGKYRTMRGIEIPAYPLDKIFMEIPKKRNSMKTISCADGVNEVGMGKLPRGIIPKNEKIQSVVPVDYLVVGGTADWAAFGLIATLSLMTGEPLLPTADEQEKLLKAVVSVGAVDGITGENTLSVDTLPLERHKRKMAQLRFISY